MSPKPFFEYSPSGRARCKKCFDILPAAEVRLGVPIKTYYGGRVFLSTGYYHVECFSYKRNAAAIPGFETLEASHQVRIATVVSDLLVSQGKESAAAKRRRLEIVELSKKGRDLLRSSGGNLDKVTICSAYFRIFSSQRRQREKYKYNRLIRRKSNLSIEVKNGRVFLRDKKHARLGYFEKYETVCVLLPILGDESLGALNVSANLVDNDKNKTKGPKLLVRVDFKHYPALLPDVLKYLENNCPRLKLFGGLTGRCEDDLVGGAMVTKLLDHLSNKTKFKTSSEQETEFQELTRISIRTRLFDHQVFAGLWMQNMENKVDGGLLADTMGSGKTLTVLALVAFTLAKEGVLKDRKVDCVGDLEISSKSQSATSEKNQEKSSGPWNCLMCKWENSVDQSNCSFCSEPKPSMKEIKMAFFSPKKKRKKLGKTVTNVSPKKKVKKKPFVAVLRTLVVCQPSVLSNWKLQCERHYNNLVSFKCYHGASRNFMDAFDYDIVITTYDTVAHEFRKRDDLENKSDSEESISMFSVKWDRVVLDEAHVIRNTKSLRHKACSSLIAKSRWALTGTPIINKTADLQSLVQFLRFEPFHKPGAWKRAIGEGVSQNQRAVLQKLLGKIMLRRRLQDIGSAGQLPEKVLQDIPVILTERERQTYNLLFRAAGLVFEAACRSPGGIFKDYTCILGWILRLRQACCSPGVVPERVLKVASEVVGLFKKAPVGESEAQELLDKVKECFQANSTNPEEGEECCCICLCPLQSDSDVVIIRVCKHSFCYSCISAWMKQGEGQLSKTYKCPLCRSMFKSSDMLSTDDLKRIIGNTPDTPGVSCSGESAKITALVKSLKSCSISSTGEKAIVFSQFLGFISTIEDKLAASGFTCAKITGGMNVKEREKSIAALNSGSASVLLISLQCGNTGLNLERASRVYLMDPWWATATEEQAIARAHRMGQKRKVYAYRLYANNTIEERVRQIQKDKDSLTRAILSADSKSKEQKAVTLLERLFAFPS